MSAAPAPERSVERVDQPLLLITQAQRSGGTLLLRLLDGHPECHVAPFQLRGIDEAAKHLPETPAGAWEALHHPKLDERALGGYRQQKGEVLRDEETHPFHLDAGLQREIFDACVAGLGTPSARDLFNCYFTSYFNAWLDYANRSGGPKRWVVGFEPGVSRSLRRRQALREVYPEGRGLSIVRDPWSWYASARRWEPQWRDRESAIEHWHRAAAGAFKWRGERKRGGGVKDVRLVSFEALLADTEQTMRHVAAWLAIEFRPELLEPTFNGRPIRANTSFSDVATGVSSRPLERAQEGLSDDDREAIEARCGDLYRKLVSRAEQDWPAP